MWIFEIVQLPKPLQISLNDQYGVDFLCRGENGNRGESVVRNDQFFDKVLIDRFPFTGKNPLFLDDGLLQLLICASEALISSCIKPMTLTIILTHNKVICNRVTGFWDQ